MLPVSKRTTLFDFLPEHEMEVAPQQRRKTEGRIITGDSLSALKELKSDLFQSCITSPPYWGLRDYGIKGQIGAEMKFEDYVTQLVEVFREVKRALRPDGTLWLNIGDSYTSGGRKWRQADKKNPARGMDYRPPTPDGLKSKDLIGVPWRLAFALQADGWYLMTDIIWHKPNGVPESVKDRPSRLHEYVFLLTKEKRYKYHYERVKEPAMDGSTKGLRSVWSLNTEPMNEMHFAAFPTRLVARCMEAGSDENDIVIDPFFGSGTVGIVAHHLNRNFIGIELNPEYVDIAKRRLKRLGIE